MQRSTLVAVTGLVGLASAMGIGRFAFTPILPLMQEQQGLSLVVGSWLASINYLGYLIGALCCIGLTPKPANWAKKGLLVVALSTLAMAIPGEGMVLWMLWRLLAGVASAFVLVGISAWCLDQLARLDHTSLNGWVYAGVGVGIAVAGLGGLFAGVLGWHPAVLWLLLGVLAFLIWWYCKSFFEDNASNNGSAENPVQGIRWIHWCLIFCYGVFGLGYILPATFLPALARDQLTNPAVFGWVWPIFGLAAAASTWAVSRFFGGFSPKRIWAVASLVMMLGVAMPVLSSGLFVLILAAICVGGTFMVLTMAGMQEAKKEGGAKLMAAMTASFASGQILGPLLINLTDGSLFLPSLAGAGLLLFSSLILLWLPEQDARR